MAQNNTPELQAEAGAVGAAVAAIMETNLGRWADRMARKWADLLAVVPFGSWACGTARPDSDWDLALIAETWQPDAVPELGEQVQAISFPPAVLRRRYFL